MVYGDKTLNLLVCWYVNSFFTEILCLVQKFQLRLSICMTSVLPQGHGFRNELIEMIDDIKPQFVRFPGMYGFLFMIMFWLRL